MTNFISCTLCDAQYPEYGAPYRCECGGVFTIHQLPVYDTKKIQDDDLRMWKYKRMFLSGKEIPAITLGEGCTPFVSTGHAGKEIYLKVESQNPTGSYKDRGTAVLISFLAARGVTKIVEDSSGNAGASLAAYAAKAGMKARIFVPESASGSKRTQIESYGADLVCIPGPRKEAARAVLAESQKGAVYASHAYMPFGLAGIATIAYELMNDLACTPGTIIAPVGHGGLMYGIMLGFDALYEAGLIKKLPYYVGVQSAGCAPIVNSFIHNKPISTETLISPSLAEGVKVVDPVRGREILDRMKNGIGRMIAIGEPDLGESYRFLSRTGIYCEPTSALAFAPLINGKIVFPEPIVSIITGSGYKSNLIL